MAAAEESASLWLEAHEDPLAGLCSFPGCMALVDLHGDGDHKLVVGVPRGPGGPRLAVVRGAGSISSLALPEAPAGLGAFGPAFGGSGGSGAGAGGGPAVVVAAGPALYVYRNLRPFFKFSLPPRAPEPLERDLWLQAEQDQIDPLMLKEMLEDLRDKAEVPLTAQSLRLLALPPPELGPFVALHKGRPLQRQTVVTCLGALPRGGPEGTPDCPVLGTEAGDVLVLDPEAFTVICKGWVPSPPAFVAPRGPGDGRCRLGVACRDGTLRGLSRSREQGRVLGVLGSRPAGLIPQDWGLLAATADGTLQAFSPQGRRLWALRLPGPISGLAGAALPGRGLGAALVALGTPPGPSGELRLYRGRTLLCTLKTQEVVTGLCFGRYGREENTLLSTGHGGALSIRMLRRRADLGGGSRGRGGRRDPPRAPPPPCPSPPRTRLFVDRALREREDAPRMLGRFQQDLGGLRLAAARGLARALGGGAAPKGGDPPLTLTATVQGLGPPPAPDFGGAAARGGPPDPQPGAAAALPPPPRNGCSPPASRCRCCCRGCASCSGPGWSRGGARGGCRCWCCAQAGRGRC
ncbi:BBSome complex member BBS1 isoform X3 [Agelaius phoeniceus]|uniref:BBSome complex member BBS1 isoform X3 n=1 Tax=Agelaius phoeniceus TaxID=39638 RepID=UPI00405529D0